MKRQVNELTVDELKKVFEENHVLQEKVFEDMFDSAAYWCSEYLKCWNKGIDYCIGWDRGTYFKRTDNEYFIDGLKTAQKTFNFLSDEYDSIIAYVEKLMERLNSLYYDGSTENYERVENRIDELIEELENACYKRFMLEYESCFDSNNQIDYFIEFYADARMDGDFYVDENFALFEHVEYIKKYS